MKLETKYGVLKGTVEEFKELLKGKKDLSYFSGEADCSWEEDIKPTYKIVNKDTIAYNSGVRIFKGIVLEHTSRDWYTTQSMYTDTMGNLYKLHESDLDDYNMSWVDVKFRTHKDKSLLLVQKEEENKSGYYIVNKDNVACFLDSDNKLPTGLVLKHIVEDAYEDTLGVRYLLYAKDLDDCSMPWVEGKFKSHKDKGELLKVGYDVDVKDKYFVVTRNVESLFNRGVLDKGTILKQLDRYTYMDTLGKKYGDAIEGYLKEVSIQSHVGKLYDEAVDLGTMLVLEHLAG